MGQDSSKPVTQAQGFQAPAPNQSKSSKNIKVNKAALVREKILPATTKPFKASNVNPLSNSNSQEISQHYSNIIKNNQESLQAVGNPANLKKPIMFENNDASSFSENSEDFDLGEIEENATALRKNMEILEKLEPASSVATKVDSIFDKPNPKSANSKVPKSTVYRSLASSQLDPFMPPKSSQRVGRRYDSPSVKEFSHNHHYSSSKKNTSAKKKTSDSQRLELQREDFLNKINSHFQTYEHHLNRDDDEVKIDETGEESPSQINVSKTNKGGSQSKSNCELPSSPRIERRPPPETYKKKFHDEFANMGEFSDQKNVTNGAGINFDESDLDCLQQHLSNNIGKNTAHKKSNYSLLVDDMSLSGGEGSLHNQISPKIPKIDLNKKLGNLEEVEFSFKPQNFSKGQSRYCNDQGGQPNIPDDISIIPSNMDSNTHFDDTIPTVNTTPKEVKSFKQLPKNGPKRFDDGIQTRKTTIYEETSIAQSFEENQKPEVYAPPSKKVEQQEPSSTQTTTTKKSAKPPTKKKVPIQNGPNHKHKKSKTPDQSKIVKNNLSKDYSVQEQQSNTVRSMTPTHAGHFHTCGDNQELSIQYSNYQSTPCQHHHHHHHTNSFQNQPPYYVTPQTYQHQHNLSHHSTPSNQMYFGTPQTPMQQQQHFHHGHQNSVYSQPSAQYPPMMYPQQQQQGSFHQHHPSQMMYGQPQNHQFGSNPGIYSTLPNYPSSYSNVSSPSNQNVLYLQNMNNVLQMQTPSTMPSHENRFDTLQSYNTHGQMNYGSASTLRDHPQNRVHRKEQLYGNNSNSSSAYGMRTFDEENTNSGSLEESRENYETQGAKYRTQPKRSVSSGKSNTLKPRMKAKPKKQTSVRESQYNTESEDDRGPRDFRKKKTWNKRGSPDSRASSQSRVEESEFLARVNSKKSGILKESRVKFEDNHQNAESYDQYEQNDSKYNEELEEENRNTRINVLEWAKSREEQKFKQLNSNSKAVKSSIVAKKESESAYGDSDMKASNVTQKRAGGLKLEIPADELKVPSKRVHKPNKNLNDSKMDQSIDEIPVKQTPLEFKSPQMKSANNLVENFTNKHFAKNARIDLSAGKESPPEKAVKMVFTTQGEEDAQSEDTGADSKTLAEMFKLRKNQLVQRLNDKNKGSSGANKAFKEIDKQELYQKRRQMRKFKTQDKLEKQDFNMTAGAIGTTTLNAKTPIREAHHQKQSSVMAYKSTQSTSKKRDNSSDLMDRLALGSKAKMSRKDMFELTSKKYNNLPEVKKQREEKQKKEKWLEDLKSRKNKVKELDSKLRRGKSVSKPEYP